MLSIVIPTYNEAKRLPESIVKISDFLNKKYPIFEMVIVDDGSRDGTPEYLKKISLENNKIKIFLNEKNRGKGAVVKQGMLAATGDWILFMDADYSTPIDEVDKFFNLINRGGKIEVIIGTRKKVGANIIKHQSLVRENMGKVFTRLSRLMLGVKLSDFTCGFKMFSREAARKIFSRQTIDRWGFDSEILFLASKLGFNIKEVPVSWINSEATRVNLVKDSLGSFRDLLKIRKNYLTGKYH